VGPVNLTVVQLRYVLAVADEEHFTRAAEGLHLSAAALSQQVAAAERRLGVVLFHRNSRGVRLTEAGQELLPLARRVVAAMDEVTSWGRARRDAGEVLRVGVPIGWMIMSRVLAGADEQLPAVRLETHRIGFRDGVDAVRSGRVDVALAPYREPPQEPDLRVVPLWTEGRSLVVGAGHRLAARASIGLEESNGDRFVGFGDAADRADWLVVPRPDGTVPRIDAAADTFEDVLDLCSAGLAVHVVGASAAATHLRPDLRFVPIADTWDVTCCLLRRRHASSGAAPAFEQLVLDVVDASAAEHGVRPCPRVDRHG